MKKNEKIKVGISVGDINGIGIEVILKTFADTRMLDFCTPVIFCASKILSIHAKALNLTVQINGVSSIDKVVPNKVNAVSLTTEQINVELGKETKEAGTYAYLSLEAATKALQNDNIDVLVTAPINKHNIQSEKFNFKGHTEYLESQFEGESLMILMTDEIRIGLITGHIPVTEIGAKITADLIEKIATIMHTSLIKDFGISDKENEGVYHYLWSLVNDHASFEAAL
jgi:4-hydroxythreonine-4-phosphate dehydrogenase